MSSGYLYPTRGSLLMQQLVSSYYFINVITFKNETTKRRITVVTRIKVEGFRQNQN